MSATAAAALLQIAFCTLAGALTISKYEVRLLA